MLALILALPLCGGLLNACLGTRLQRRMPAMVGCTAVILSFLLSITLFPQAADGLQSTLFTWLQSDGFSAEIGLLFDPLAAVMTVMVTGVASLIHLYAIGYMEEERDQARFFALLNLFVFAMLTIILADNLLLMFLGWEGVGFCSYALIGFWYRHTENAAAGRKAFIVTRIGDLFFTVGLLWLFSLFGTIGIEAINERAGELDLFTLTAIALLLLGGACGKSAQLPLSTWLPDAMAGPTPVSALIHAATMVTAGVYLLCRMFPLISLSEPALDIIAVVGMSTALYAASCALAQREIKRVLAYSTMSQVGYMFLAVGLGSVSAALFHLLTHAFFKALLFMGAGCIINLAGHENNIYRMGGLRKYSRSVFWLFIIGLLCLAGAPLTEGFFSKDLILVTAFAHGDLFHYSLYGVAVATAGLTSFYSFRLAYLVFAGDYRGNDLPHPLSQLMIWTLVPLGITGLAGDFINLPHFVGGHAWLSHWLERPSEVPHLPLQTEYILIGIALVTFLIGWLVAHVRYRCYRYREIGAVKGFLLHGWYLDTLFDALLVRPFRKICRFLWQGVDLALIDGLAEGFARACFAWGHAWRFLADGKISRYLQGFAWGLLLILGWFLLQAATGGGG